MSKINGYGAISTIAGILLSIYGIVHNNSTEAQLRNGASGFLNDVTGKKIIEADNSGTVCIVIGVILIIVGIIMLRAESETYYSENKKDEQQIDYEDENDYVESNQNENYRTEYVNNYSKNYEDIIKDMDKIYNLYKNGIYNEEDYSKKKESWINRLKNLKSVKEEDLLNEILPFVKNNAFTADDLDRIKYVISDQYVEDEIKREREEIRKIRKQREELRAQKEKHDRESGKEQENQKEELTRRDYETINEEISKIKSEAIVFFNRVRSFIEKKLAPYSKKKLIGVICILAFVIIFISIGILMSSPKRAVMAFENASNENNARKLSNTLYTYDERLKITPDGVQSLLKTFKSSPSEFTDVIDNLNNQAINIKNGWDESKTSNLYITKTGRIFLIFPKYKIAVNPVFLTVTSNLKGTDILIDGKKIANADSDNFSKQFGPCIPGLYQVEGKAKGTIGEIKSEVQVDFIKDKKQNETVNALKGLYLTVTSDYENNEIYIDGKDTGKSVNSGDKIGPVASGSSIYAIINYNGVKAKSTAFKLSDTDTDINFDYSSQGEDPKKQRNDINDMITGYASALADALTSGNTSNLINYMYPGSKIYSQQMNNINLYYKGNDDFYEKYDSSVINSYKMDPDGKSGTVDATEVYDINEHNTDFGSRVTTRTFQNVYRFKYNDTTNTYQLTERTSAVEK